MYFPDGKWTQYPKYINLNDCQRLVRNRIIEEKWPLTYYPSNQGERIGSTGIFGDWPLFAESWYSRINSFWFLHLRGYQ